MKINDVLEELRKYKARDLDFSDGRILSSMCTSPHRLARRAFLEFIDTNLGDPGLFQGTKELEEKAIRFMAELFNSKEACGFICSGGTEANITALWVARNLSRKKEIIVPETAHFSFIKASNLLGLRLKVAKIDENHEVVIEDVRRKLDRKNTAAIVGIVGTTEYGSIDDIESLSEIAEDRDIYLHIDAAFGGLVVPFLDIQRKFDFSLAGVCSITVDPHKMGMAPIPCGSILFRNREFLEYISTPTPYLTQKRQHTLLGTRTGASAAAAYAMFRFFGREGYRKVVKRCMKVTYYLYEKIKSLGLEVFYPTMNILVFNTKDNERIFTEISKRGWMVSRTRKGEIRVVIMPHVKIKQAREFIGDLEEICGRFLE